MIQDNIKNPIKATEFNAISNDQPYATQRIKAELIAEGVEVKGPKLKPHKELERRKLVKSMREQGHVDSDFPFEAPHYKAPYCTDKVENTIQFSSYLYLIEAFLRRG